MYSGVGGGDVCTVVWVVVMCVWWCGWLCENVWVVVMCVRWCVVVCVTMCGWWWCLYGGVGGGVCTVVWVGCVGGECG